MRAELAAPTERPARPQCGRWVSLACIVLLASTSCDPDLAPRGVRAPHDGRTSLVPPADDGIADR